MNILFYMVNKRVVNIAVLMAIFLSAGLVTPIAFAGDADREQEIASIDVPAQLLDLDGDDKQDDLFGASIQIFEDGTASGRINPYKNFKFEVNWGGTDCVGNTAVAHLSGLVYLDKDGELVEVGLFAATFRDKESVESRSNGGEIILVDIVGPGAAPELGGGDIILIDLVGYVVEGSLDFHSNPCE